MSKAHRGKGIRDQYAHGRGECPVCKRNNVKILYEMDAGEQKFKICKTCKAAIKNGNKKLPVVAAEKPAEPVAEAAAPAVAETTATPAAEPAAEKTEAPAAEAAPEAVTETE